MSRMTLSQARATYALRCADAIAEAERKAFQRVVMDAPVRVLTNGLILTLAFWEGKTGAEHKAAEKALSDWILYRLTEGVGAVPPASIPSRKRGELLRALTGQMPVDGVPNPATMEGLAFATEESLALLGWLKRMVAREGYAPEGAG